MPKINFGGKEVDALSIRFKSVREEWNEYNLEDGTTLKMKSVASDILRVIDHYDQEGNPVYIVKSTNLVVVDSPDNLKKTLNGK